MYTASFMTLTESLRNKLQEVELTHHQKSSTVLKLWIRRRVCPYGMPATCLARGLSNHIVQVCSKGCLSTTAVASFTDCSETINFSISASELSSAIQLTLMLLGSDSCQVFRQSMSCHALHISVLLMQGRRTAASSGCTT